MSPERARARLFDREAERYDRTRPRYPAALIDAVLGPDAQGLRVLDVACGTGIAAVPMAKRGAQVLGVELNPRMAAIAQRHGIETEVAAFENWEPDGRVFDRVTCAQAWHWLDQQQSVEKIVSVLAPAGRLCLFWSIGRYPDDLADALSLTYHRVLPADAPPLVIGYAANRSNDPVADLSLTADALAECPAFAEPRLVRFPWSRTYTREMWLDELLSHSDHAALSPGLRERLLAAIGETIDRFGGTFTMSYTSLLISAALR